MKQSKETIFPEIRVLYHENPSQLHISTTVRIKGPDGKWYKTMVIQNHHDICNGIRTFVHNVHLMINLGIPDPSIMPENKHPCFVLDECQQEEKERLNDLHVKPFRPLYSYE